MTALHRNKTRTKCHAKRDLHAPLIARLCCSSLGPVTLQDEQDAHRQAASVGRA
jgi:hypothetical protein